MNALALWLFMSPFWSLSHADPADSPPAEVRSDEAFATEFGAFASEIEAGHPKRVKQSWILEGRGYVRFNGEVPVTATEILKASDLVDSVELQPGNPFPLSDRTRRHEIVAQVLAEYDYGCSIVDFDPDANTTRIDLGMNDDAKPPTSEALSKRIGEEVLKDAAKKETTLQVTDPEVLKPTFGVTLKVISCESESGEPYLVE